MPSFAFYRLPHLDSYVRVEGSVQELYSCAELNGKSGYVVAPFDIRQNQPILLIHPDRVSVAPVPDAISRFTPVSHRPDAGDDTAQPAAERASRSRQSYYAIDFANFHAQLQQGTFRKIVLARCANEQSAPSTPPEQLFFRACHLYPRMFIALFYTPQSGLWLTATPEILLEGSGSQWRTIALAGTVKLEGDQLDSEGEGVAWGVKDIEEQRIVATYIAECLEQQATDFSESGPRTVRAANLVHLRSDFTFTLPDDRHLGSLVSKLHPTPAVCGLPKRETFQFIVRNEHSPRRYYSGFQGPLGISQSTHLYVSLRCMSIDDDGYHLYAGGGLLRDSVMQQEWQETEAKLETMRRLIAGA